VSLTLAPSDGGIAVSTLLNDLEIDGNMSITALGLPVSSAAVRMTATNARMAGQLDLSLNFKDNTIAAAVPEATASLTNFQYSSGNGGFPCCFDSAMTGYVKPKLETAFHDEFVQHVPEAVMSALDGFKISSTLDLSADGLSAHVPVAGVFDGVAFNNPGGVLMMSLLFGSPFAPSQPGAKVPGWLSLGSQPAVSDYASPLELSFSLDAVNQFLFAAWGTGSLAMAPRDVPPITGLTLKPALPPLLVPSDSGSLKVMLGELVATASLGGNAPFTVALNIINDVAPSLDGNDLVLTSKGTPTMTLTWLVDRSVPDSTKQLIMASAQEQLGNLLKPIRIPLPTISLDKLGGTFTGASLKIDSPAIHVDSSAGRISAKGAVSLVRN
jgi:hypothetical protein